MEHLKKQILSNTALLLIPALFVVTGMYFYSIVGAYYLRAVDPEYLYLFSGMTMARFKFELGHIDNPGTPLQIIIAIIIRISNLSKNDSDLVQTVINNPEPYLQATFYILLIINCTILFILGKIASNITGLFGGFFIQIIPFSSIHYMATVMRVRPETLQLFSLCLLIILILYHVQAGFKYGKTIKPGLFALVIALDRKSVV